MGHMGSDDFIRAGKWPAKQQQGGEIPVDEALEEVHCYIKFKEGLFICLPEHLRA